jgi:hypothetical protein
MAPRKSDVAPVAKSKTLGKAPGFAERGSAFETQLLSTGSQDDTRFAEKMALVRSFSLIESDAARQQVIDLAHRLSGE